MCKKQVGLQDQAQQTHIFLIIRHTEEIKKILIKDQQKYQSGIGMLLYLVKHSQPNLANTTRELSKANDGANTVAYKKLLHLIKYVINKKNLGLRIKPMGNFKEPWEIECFSNSDYAGDPVSKHSISGFILHVLGVPVSWWLKSQKKGFSFQLRMPYSWLLRKWCLWYSYGEVWK